MHTPANIDLLISNDDYLNAIKMLDTELFNDPRVKETFRDKDPETNQMFINGSNDCIVAWNNYGFTSMVIVFIKVSSNYKSLYSIQPGRDVTAVKQMDLGLGKNFIEITSYSGSGSNMREVVKILCVDDKIVTEAWSYETISFYARSKDTYSKTYASFTVFPKVFDTPRINLHQVEISEKGKNEMDTTFLWDDKQNKFVSK